MIALLAAAQAADPLMDAVVAEMDRAKAELRLPDAPGPWFVSAVAREGTRTAAAASLGAVTDPAIPQPFRQLDVVVRTGSSALDNTNFDTWRDGSGTTRLVAGDDPLALRHDAWLLLDDQYKAAVEALAAKEAARSRRAEPVEVPSFAPGEPVVAVDPVPDVTIDGPALEALVREVSRAFRDHPAVEVSSVAAAVTAGRIVIADTGGTRVVRPANLAWVTITARVRADDGAVLVDQVRHLALAPDGLPAADALVADAEALAARIEGWRALPAEEEEYVGPVLFEGAAAIDLFRWLLLPALSGTPPVEQAPRGSRVVVWDDRAEPGPVRIRRRVLPSGWDVVDDPLADPGLPSSYAHDVEGVPAERVELVRDGVVRAHLMSRIPSQAMPESNGHGRGETDDPVRAGPAIATVTPERPLSERKLHKTALKLAADYDLDHYLVVRRIRPPGTERIGGGPWMTGRSFFGFDDAGGLPPPVEVVRVSADGTERPLRGLDLAGLDVRSLAGVVAAGASSTATFLGGPDAARGGGYPVTLTAPDVLLGEVELAPSTAPSEKPPRVPSPLAAQ